MNKKRRDNIRKLAKKSLGTDKQYAAHEVAALVDNTILDEYEAIAIACGNRRDEITDDAIQLDADEKFSMLATAAALNDLSQIMIDRMTAIVDQWERSATE